MDTSIPGQQLDASGTEAPPLSPALRVALKVPEITIFFWIVKLLTTAMGESTSDYLVYTINPYIAVTLGFVGFVIALALQLSVRRYIAWIYWLAALMVAIFGTMAADVLHVEFNVPYLDSTIFFAVVLAIVFAVWYAVERTLSIHSIYTLRRELFYWAAIVTTFALGTAIGDETAYSLKLGTFISALLYAVLFALPGIGYGVFRLNAIFAFWFAYILTRPLGAEVADWLGKPPSSTGLGIGDGPVAAVLGILLVLFVGYLTLSRVDVQGSRAPARGPEDGRTAYAPTGRI